MYKPCLVLLVALLTSLWIFGQAPAEVLLKHSVVVRDSSGTLTESFKSAMKTELQDVRIIALGEASHEDGGTFEQKAELVKFLHQELGFVVLAFEFGFYGNWNTYQKLGSGAEIDQATRYSGWAKSVYAYPVYQYFAETANTETPLIYAGFDGEKVPDGIPNIKSFLADLTDRLNFKIDTADARLIDLLIEAIYGGLGNDAHDQINYQDRKRATHLLDSLHHEVAANREAFQDASDETFRMYLLPLKSIRMDEKSSFAGNFRNIVRDKHMAERIIWLADSLYKDKKIILWGASGHFARQMVAIDRTNAPGSYGYYPYYQAGDWLSEYFGDAYYSIAFVAGGGEIGTIYPEGHRFKQYEEIIKLEGFDPESYEHMAQNTGVPFLYTSLKNLPPDAWLHRPFKAYPLGYENDHADWKKVFDAFYFIREMKPDRWRE